MQPKPKNLSTTLSDEREGKKKKKLILRGRGRLSSARDERETLLCKEGTEKSHTLARTRVVP